MAGLQVTGTGLQGGVTIPLTPFSGTLDADVFNFTLYSCNTRIR